MRGLLTLTARLSASARRTRAMIIFRLGAAQWGVNTPTAAGAPPGEAPAPPSGRLLSMPMLPAGREEPPPLLAAVPRCSFGQGSPPSVGGWREDPRAAGGARGPAPGPHLALWLEPLRGSSHSGFSPGRTCPGRLDIVKLEGGRVSASRRAECVCVCGGVRLEAGAHIPRPGVWKMGGSWRRCTRYLVLCRQGCRWGGGERRLSVHLQL